MKNKMTDEQIIKTLECCSSADNDCLPDCPLYGEYDSCFSTLLKPILELINRLQAENERMIASGYALDIKTVKAEAIKEFAERLHNLIHSDWQKIHQQINNLVKEMVGEE